MTTRKTKLEAEFVANDEHRAWAADKLSRYTAAAYYLPDAVIERFLQYHKDRIEDGTPAHYANWDRAFQNFIRWETPSGQFYNPREWERTEARAKRAKVAAEGETQRSTRAPKRIAGIDLPGTEVRAQTAGELVASLARTREHIAQARAALARGVSKSGS